jgi:predicted MFS family arabinose efflux permease
MNRAAVTTQPEPADASRPQSQVAAMVAEWRQSWRPGVAALLGAACAYSVWTSVSSLFVQPLQDEFGWSRGQIALAHNAGLVTAFIAPLIGRAVDRLGVRPVLIGGLVGTAICYALFAAMWGSLIYYYAVYFLCNVIGMCTTGITYTRVIVGGFTVTRGSALAIARSGMGLSTALLPILLFAAISRWGFQGGFLTLAVLILCISLPLAWIWIPSKQNETRLATALLPESESWAVLVRRPKVLLLCLASALNYAPVAMLMTQMVPLAVSKGLTAAEGVAAVSSIGLAALGGALLSGFLVDRFWAPIIAAVLNLASAIGCLFLLSGIVSPWLFYASVVLVGVGQGAEIDIVAYMAARYFGMRSYATIYGLSVLAIALAVAGAASAIGLLYDAFGNYNIALMAASVSFALAAMCYLGMGRYPSLTHD